MSSRVQLRQDCCLSMAEWRGAVTRGGGTTRRAMKRSRALPCKGLHSVSPGETTSVCEARLWLDPQHLMQAATYEGAGAVVWLSSC